MTDYYQIMEKMYSRKSKAYLSPYNESQEQRREELLSRESFNGKYTEQQRIDGLREIFEAHWQVTIPKTAKCPHCSKDRGVGEYIDDDGITHRTEGKELVLAINYEKMPTGGYRVTGTIQ